MTSRNNNNNGPHSTQTIKIEESGSFTYIGYANLNSQETASVWKIKRLQESGSFTFITYSNGSDDYDVAWENRHVVEYK